MSSNHPIWRNTAFALAAVLFFIALRFSSASGRVEPAGELRVERPLMGTNWSIEVVDESRSGEGRRAIDRAYTELERIDRLMSEWKPESPVSHINDNAGKQPVEVPRELRELIERSIRYSIECQGTFDITWRGMGRIWHFDDAFVPPTAAVVAEARKNVDYRRIQVDGNRIFLRNTGMNIGLGGIAKGYAIDRAAQVLAQAGFHNWLVDGGGDVLVSGTRNGNPWRLGIQDPRADHGNVLGMVRSTKGAVVTSGDYERFRIVNGVRYHHIIDPRTGYPANASISVTVLADSAERAVVLAKGIYILGPEKGMALARSEGVEALLIDPNGRRFFTDGFARAFEAN